MSEELRVKNEELRVMSVINTYTIYQERKSRLSTTRTALLLLVGNVPYGQQFNMRGEQYLVVQGTGDVVGETLQNTEIISKLLPKLQFLPSWHRCFPR